MKKTKAQRKYLWKNKMVPFLWLIFSDDDTRMTAMNWLTGTFRVLEK